MKKYSVIGDLELLGLMAQGKKDAFEEVYDRYWKRMLQIAWNHTKDKAHAEDIVHEVFLSLWENRREVQIENISGYLATSIKFSIYKHFRREQRRTLLARQNYAFSEFTDDEKKLDALFLEEYINGVIEQLPEKCKLTFRYSRIEGLSNAEIAARMEISEKGVEANLTRALKVLRSNLKNSGLLIIISSTVWKDLL